MGSCLDRICSYGGFMLPNTWDPEARGLPKIRSQPGLRLPKPKKKKRGRWRKMRKRRRKNWLSFCKET